MVIIHQQLRSTIKREPSLCKKRVKYRQNHLKWLGTKVLIKSTWLRTLRVWEALLVSNIIVNKVLSKMLIASKNWTETLKEWRAKSKMTIVIWNLKLMSTFKFQIYYPSLVQTSPDTMIITFLLERANN